MTNGTWIPFWYGAREILLRHDADNPQAYDHELVANPRMAFLNDKWFMYYKCRRDPSRPTDNAIATADNLLGPYTKFKGNPICQGIQQSVGGNQVVGGNGSAAGYCRRRQATGTI